MYQDEILQIKMLYFLRLILKELMRY